MFMVSFRLRKGKILAGLLAVALVVSLGVMGVRTIRSNDAVSTGSNQVQATGKAKKVTLKTNDQRLEYIRSFGWEVEEEPAEVLEVIIPKEFDSVYESYNGIQRKQGYNLEDHAGKRCKRFSYVVTNYPGQTEDVRINLLVRDNKVIGGDVCSLLPEGFIHGLSLPQGEEAPAPDTKV